MSTNFHNSYIQNKVQEYIAFVKSRRLKNMPPAPFQIPTGGIASFHIDEQDPGTPIPNYIMKLSRVRRQSQKLDIKSVIEGVAQHSPRIDLPIWNIFTSPFILKQRLCYWHAEDTTLFFTHRNYGQIRIVYTQDIWENIAPDLLTNFSIFEIPTPDSNSSSSSEDEEAGRTAIPGPTDLPFHKVF